MHQQTNQRESNKEMERLPSVGGVSSSCGCSPSWQRVRAGRLHQLRSDFPSLVGGREEEGARDSVWESLRNPRIGALNILAFHHSDSSLLSSWLPALPIDQKFLSPSSFARGRKTFYKYLYLSQRLSLLISPSLISTHIKVTFKTLKKFKTFRHGWWWDALSTIMTPLHHSADHCTNSSRQTEEKPDMPPGVCIVNNRLWYLWYVFSIIMNSLSLLPVLQFSLSVISFLIFPIIINLISIYPLFSVIYRCDSSTFAIMISIMTIRTISTLHIYQMPSVLVGGGC